MLPTLGSLLVFDPDKFEPKDAVVAVFDIAGFTEYCHHVTPKFDAARLVARLLNEIHLSVQTSVSLWTGRGKAVFRDPDHVGYTGDGALLIWTRGDEGDWDPWMDMFVVFAMRRFQTHAQKRLKVQIRVGITAGEVYKIIPNSKSVPPIARPQYIGHCINLASRIQSNSQKLGFVIHESVQGLDIARQNELNLTPLVMSGLKGLEQEPQVVFADLEDWNRLLRSEKIELAGRIDPLDREGFPVAER